MKITINGQEKNIPAPTDLRSLIERLCKTPARVVAELNGEVVRNQEWERRHLKDGDSVELANFVGGG